MGLRIVAVTLLLGLSLTFQVTKGERVETFYALIIFTYAVTIPYAPSFESSQVLKRWFNLRGPKSPSISCSNRIDRTTGGIESPFAVLYVISVTVASLVPRRAWGF